MATIYHFQPWCYHGSGKELNHTISGLTKNFQRMVEEGDIYPVEIYPHKKVITRADRFYSVKEKVLLAKRNIEHNFALIDVLTAFLFLYQDFDIEIKTNPRIITGGKEYRPDAIVKMNKGGLEYDFIIELERTRSAEAIYKEKLLPNSKLDLKKSGLHRRTKFLYIYCTEWMNVFWRPSEYNNPEPQKQIARIDEKFPLVVAHAKYLPDSKFRFIPYHQFINIDKPIWHTPLGNKVSLI